MKKLFFLGCVLLVMVFHANAQRISADEAYMVGSRFVSEKCPATQAKAPMLTLQKIVENETGQPCLYQYKLNDKGFLVVSASRRTPAILAYSLDNDLEMIPPVRDLFYLYQQEIDLAEEGDAPPTLKAEQQWNHYMASDFAPSQAKGKPVFPLLTTVWNQNKYYNTYCPWDASAGYYYDYRVPNGCVALACAQIMNYHRFPEHGIGASSYFPRGYDRQTVYFSKHKYNWDAMCNEPEDYANEIAKLAYHFGVAIQMSYTADGSGAATENAKKELMEKFLYDPSISIYYRGNFLDTTVRQYIAALKKQLDNRLPVYYSGCTQAHDGCHAYVVDGYDADELFHINYGWGGSCDGYYALDNFTSTVGRLDYFSQAIFNIYPNRLQEQNSAKEFQRNTATFGYVADGSPTHLPYEVNPDYSWMVAAPRANKYVFHFDRLDVADSIDFVTIYNGPTKESGVLAKITGSELPEENFTVNADSVLITFTSTGEAETNDHYGFLISYTSTVPAAPCASSKNIKEWHTVIEDGSDENGKYYPQTNCSWNVNLQYINGYAFNFPKFELGYGDFVDVYDNTSNPPTLYKRFDLYNMPEGVYNVKFSKMKINFVADNWDESNGFKLEYYAIAGVDSYSGIESLKVYPNPSRNNMFVSFSLEESEMVNCKLMDAAGKVLSTKQINAVAGENKDSFDVSSLTAGFYLLELSTSKGKTIQKVMVQ